MDQATLDKFLEGYSRLLVFDLQRRVGGAAILVSFDKSDARQLIRIASGLAFGPSSHDKETEARWKSWAYDAVTRIAVLWAKKDSRFQLAADLILARLGNFPGRQHLREAYAETGLNIRYPPTLAIESLVREEENTIEFEGLGPRLLTDFQFRLAKSLQLARPVSVSAPTSAGKSYTLSLDIADAIANRGIKSIAYIVPTRALIRQVMQDVLDRLREAKLEEVAVSAAPTPVDHDQAEDGVVYVLTQERLLSLLYSPEGRVVLDRIYIDEAQEIGDSKRGLLLHSAVREVVSRFPSVQICFASPLTSNPEFLLKEFNLPNGESLIERQSPVSQTIAVLGGVKGDPKAIDVSVITPTGHQKVSTVNVQFEFHGRKERLAQTAKLFTQNGESSVIYANGAYDAITIALRLAELLEEKVKDPEVRDLTDFVRSHIHSRYALVDTLPKGVAFHYGKMPHLIRSQIENLLRQRKLRYVVATSTLLQGINLPAKNIFILEPKKGSGNPMRGPDFWNLAGRAGRLRENFNGTIWCIDPTGWEINPLDEPKFSDMKSSFRELLNDQATRNALLAVGDGFPLSKVGERERVEHMFGKIFSEFACEGIEVAQSQYADGSERQRLAELDTKYKDLLTAMELPSDVCRRNSSISPLNLNKLWKRFRQAAQIESMIPTDPNKERALDRMRDIFKLIDELFVESENDRWRYFAPLAYYWIRGQSLKELIANHLRHNNVASERDATNTAITKFLQDLEQVVRFEYVKYIKAYVDTLLAYLTATNQEELARSVSPLHLFIEFGARDRVLVMLMSLGLSRTTAIFLRDAISWDDDIERRECWAKLKRLRLENLDIPNLCKAEIRQLVGSS